MPRKKKEVDESTLISETPETIVQDEQMEETKEAVDLFGFTDEKESKEEEQEILNQVAKAEQVSNAEAILNRKIQKLSKQQQNHLYEDNSVIPLHETLSYETQGEKMKRDFLELSESRISHKVLHGRVTGSTEIDGKVTAIVKYGSYYKVLIPLEMFFDEKNLQRNEGEPLDLYQKRMRLLLNQRLMSEVDFIVMQIDEKNQMAVANRVAAMKHVMRSWYFAKKHNGKFVIHEGTKMEARVVATTASHLVIEVRGKEYRLKHDEISYRYIQDVSKEYEVGSTIPIVFTELERNRVKQNVYSMKASVSVKLATEDPRDRAMSLYGVGTNVVAVVTGIETYGIYCRIEDSNGEADILVLFKDGEYPKLPSVGDKVLVRINELDYEKKHLYGKITRILREAA